MPSVSAKQHRLMAAVASNPAVAKKAKIPQSVGKEFMEADKGKKFQGGGMAESKKMVAKEVALKGSVEKGYQEGGSQGGKVCKDHDVHGC